MAAALCKAGAGLGADRLKAGFGSLAKEVQLNWNMWIRQIHRWLSLAFTATVIANFIAMSLGEPPAWIVYSPLLPLFLLLFTGLYLFALPYLTKWHNEQRTSG
jgi:hypothetical protein